jgi:hypothetical protein
MLSATDPLHRNLGFLDRVMLPLRKKLRRNKIEGYMCLRTDRSVTHLSSARANYPAYKQHEVHVTMEIDLNIKQAGKRRRWPSGK